MAGVPAPAPDRLRRSLAAIALGGLAIRLAYIAATPRLHGHGDALFYHGVAAALASGRGFVDPTFGVPTALHPPLLPLWLALVAKLGGSWAAQRVAVAVLATGTIVCVGLVAERVAGAGLVAALIAAVYPVFVSADTAVMPESLFGLLVALSLLAALRLVERPTAPRAAALGVTIGLAALTRSEGVVLLPLLALPAARRRPLGIVLALVACAAVMAPWTVRNLATFKQPVLVSTNDGTILAGANCRDTYYGRDTGGWQIACVPRLVGKDESQAAATEAAEGIRYARRHGGRVPVVVSARIARTFDLYQPLRQAHHGEGRAAGLEIAGTFAFYAVAALAVAGAVALRRRRLELWLLLSPVVLAVAISAFGYGVPRFREPADIALVVLAATALTRRRAPRAPARPPPRPERPARPSRTAA